MVHFDSSSFGSVTIDGKSHRDVLVVAEEVIERFPLIGRAADDHVVNDIELEKLFEGNPEVIIIATGTAGVLRVSEEVKRKIEGEGIQLITAHTPQAIEEYNRLSETKRVNILVHTTC